MRELEVPFWEREEKEEEKEEEENTSATLLSNAVHVPGHSAVDRAGWA